MGIEYNEVHRAYHPYLDNKLIFEDIAELVKQGYNTSFIMMNGAYLCMSFNCYGPLPKSKVNYIVDGELNIDLTGQATHTVDRLKNEA